MSAPDDNALQEFMLFTACADPEVARRYLSVTRTMEDAVNLFFESGEEGGSPGHAAAPAPATVVRPSGGLSADEEAYFAAQHRLEQLEREYNEKFGFSLTRRISDLIFTREQTPATEFVAAYPRFPLPVEKAQLRDLLAYLPFMVKAPPLVVCVAAAPQTNADREVIERRPLGSPESVALLGEKATVTGVLASNGQARLLEACGVDLAKAPLLAVVCFDRHAQLSLVGALELRRPDFLQGLRGTLAAVEAQQRADQRFAENLLGGGPPEPAPAAANALHEERRLREEQERAYQQMVEQQQKEAQARRRQEAEARQKAEVEERQQTRRQELARSFTEERVAPEQAVTFLIRLPSGKKVAQAFDAQQTFQRVHDFVLTLDDKGFSEPGAEFEIRAGFPPARLPLNERIAQHFPVSAEESIDVREIFREGG